MKLDEIEKQCEEVSKWWRIYYHLLISTHIVLGVVGVAIGAVIAADISVFSLETKYLGVVSSVIVGIVSFVQPGRMASVFYSAFWRLKVAILQSKLSNDNAELLLIALSEGYERISAVQPEELRKQKQKEG
ncbi:hypothetical protein [Roseibium sp. MMSF_3544]|uniref:hypothetical protein n=1 Tax=unclassified Roseibium TaxID=2629323 RepID=UPI00273DF74D|nr:hypothetical protein [Roseibium sp. MMSF_3544]